ncbi:MAG TPA: HEAT repeat domain-containing protein [Gemmataceae bacterium]|nr:HEAT repeat domain-containing protein [Gemmataceae bacterium]
MDKLIRASWWAALILGIFSWNSAKAGHGGWSIGVQLGAPAYYRPYGPYYPYYPYYYRPYPVFVAPPPVIVQPGPVVETVVPPQAPYVSPSGVPALQPISAAEGTQAEINRHLQLLADPDERVRSDSATRLGRLKAGPAIDPLAATLAGDRSPEVRDAAARALGLIGSIKGLPALQRAAQADTDRDVRRSAQFAVEVIQAKN